MENDKHKLNNSLIDSFLLITKLQNIDIRYDDLIHKLGKKSVSKQDILYVAKEYYNLKVKPTKLNKKKLYKNPLPLLIELKENQFTILFEINENGCVIYDNELQERKRISHEEFDNLYNSHAILLSQYKFKPNSTSIPNFGLRWFIKEFFKNNKIVYHILFAAFVIQLFALVTPLFTMIIIDKVFSSSGSSTLEVLIIGLFAIAIFDFIIGYFRKHLLSHVTNIVDVTMVSKFFRHLTSLPLSFFSAKQSGDTVARFKEIESIRNFISSGFLSVIIDFPFGLIFIIVMFMFSPTLTAIVIVAIVLIFLLYGVANAILKERLKKKIQLSNDSQSYLFDCVSSIETIKSMSIEPTIRRDYEEHLSSQVKYNDKTNNISGNISQIASLINKLTVALCLWIGALAVLNDSMTAGQLIAFNMLIGRIMAPAQRIAQTLQQIYQVKISANRIKEIFRTNQEIAVNAINTNLPPIKGEVIFKNVSFKYNDDFPLVLDSLNFKIGKGDIIGIVGHSGSGKTTLLRLLQRLYMPTSGKILIDGIDTSSVDPNWLRKQMGMVMQDNVLLNKSIKDNITLVNPNVTIKEIENVCKLSGADTFIKKLPQAYDTLVGEKGSLLSTGERQRIAIARALINNPKILILDEATNAIDFESEILIQNNLQQICQNRTVFIISHRVSVLKIAQRILCLHQGKIIESGTKEELLNKPKSYFRSLCRAQNILSEIK